MSRRSLAVGALVGTLFGAGAMALTNGDGAAAKATGQQLLMAVGDTVRVAGTDVGCQVAQQSGQVMVECRRLSQPAGTYGVFIGDKRALVARFHSSRTAQVVFTAKQRGGWKACRASATTARAAASDERGCR
jgi:hypothetical protein